MGLKSVLDNYREHGLKYFTPSRAKLFLRSQLRKITGYKLKEKRAILFSEAVMYKSLTCPDCVELGHCRVCKCPIPELFVAMDVGCSDNKFPAFEQKPSWMYIRQELKKLRFKSAWKEFRNRKHWTKGWTEYKEKNSVFFTKFYG